MSWLGSEKKMGVVKKAQRSENKGLGVTIHLLIVKCTLRSHREEFDFLSSICYFSMFVL